MTTNPTPDLILYRVPADDPHGINDIPEHLRSFLDACRACHDGALHSPSSLDRRTKRTVASYMCDAGHDWTRGYSNL